MEIRIELVVMTLSKKWSFICKCYPDKCPPVRLGFGSRLELVLELEGNQTTAPVENCTPGRVRVWVRVRFGIGGNFPRM